MRAFIHTRIASRACVIACRSRKCVALLLAKARVKVEINIRKRARPGVSINGQVDVYYANSSSRQRRKLLASVHKKRISCKKFSKTTDELCVCMSYTTDVTREYVEYLGSVRRLFQRSS